MLKSRRERFLKERERRFRGKSERRKSFKRIPVPDFRQL
jgi:hypothetical protein